MADFPVGDIPERLGSFYLGSIFDLAASAIVGPHVHYDARDLTTHAVCVGMTGSGKTGLCVGLLEEAAIDRIPAIIIDPKGDMGNLLLHFPELRPEDFRPWINQDDARRKNLSIDDFADSTSKLWQKGLSDWGITSERIRMLGDSVDYVVYTPGSQSVQSINVLGSLQAPDELDSESLRETVAGTVGALLGLVGFDADPVKSQEAILLSVLFEHYWSNGQDVDLGLLVRSIQNPPVRKFGVFDVDSFFPEQARFRLAMSLNNLMASPSFAAWLTGAPLDVDGLLYGTDGKPKHSIFYIAHLSEPERMFFVTLLLNAVVAWMRRQPGTTSLRALLYFDELFGFLPPVATPPSKRPLLTLLKQARAYGLGTVLVTQNPVDLDYKALSNAGTWFIGRLQSKQDQQRLLEGLKTAAATNDRSTASLAKSISQLQSRVFIVNNVHDKEPAVFHTRWVMNYLRGPMTRSQLRTFVNAGVEEETAGPKHEPQEQTPQMVSGPSLRPALPPGLLERFLSLDPGDPNSPDAEMVYRSTVGAVATTHFFDRKHNISASRTTLHFVPPGSNAGGADWSRATVSVLAEGAIVPEPPVLDVSFAGGLPPGCNTKNAARDLGKKLEDWLYRSHRYTLLSNEDLGLVQRPDESAAAFRSRLELAAREQRDDLLDSAGEKFRRQIERLEEKREAVSLSIAEQEGRYSARRQEELLSLGETVLGFVLGRRRQLSTVATKRRMTSAARTRLETLAAKDETLREQLLELKIAAEEDAAEIVRRWDAAVQRVTHYEIAPRRTDVALDFVGVLWLPFWCDPRSGEERAAFTLARGPQDPT